MNTGNIYLIRLQDDNETFFKIGTTVHRYCRFYELMKHGYRIKIIYMVLGIDYDEALKAERQLQELFEPYLPLKKFGGYRECYSMIPFEYYKNKLHNIISKYKSITENLEISWR